MGIDIKIPIGAMFTLMGLLLTVYGFATGSDPELYKVSLGINVNLWSGIGMLLFGLVMLLLGLKSARKKAK
jgi:hypothetical protein